MIFTLRNLLIVLTALNLPFPAHAILLDCEINPDGSYHCIEISDATGQHQGTEAAGIHHGEAYSRYLEKARSQCTYQEPRKRAGGKIGGSARRSEELKAARKAYDRCVTEKARAMRKQAEVPEN